MAKSDNKHCLRTFRHASKMIAVAALLMAPSIHENTYAQNRDARIVVASGETKTIGNAGETTVFTAELLETGNGAAVNVEALGTFSGTNVNFKGNSCLDFGGAIFNSGTTTLSGCSFQGNNSQAEDGGAIFNEGALIVSGADFMGNTSCNNGGAIFNNGTLTVSDATFTSNTSTVNGGAIYNNGNMTLSGVAFTSNPGLYGRAVYNEGTAIIKGDVTISTKYDKFFNSGSGVLKWDLTSETTGKIVNYQYLDNTGFLSIIVKDGLTEEGDHILAKGDLSNISGKDSFALVDPDGIPQGSITADGSDVQVGETIYRMAKTDTSLVFSAARLSVKVVVGSKGYSTVYSTSNLIVPEGVTVFDFSYDKVSKNFEISNTFTSGILEGGKGYVIKAAPGEYSFESTSEAAQNCMSVLKGSMFNTAISGSTPAYVFDVVDEVPGFYKFSGSLKAHKAYYQEN